MKYIALPVNDKIMRTTIQRQASSVKGVPSLYIYYACCCTSHRGLGSLRCRDVKSFMESRWKCSKVFNGEGMIVYVRTSHSSNIIFFEVVCHLEVFFFLVKRRRSWFDTGTSFEHSELVSPNSFDMNWYQTYRGSGFYIGWMRGTLVYNNSLSFSPDCTV